MFLKTSAKKLILFWNILGSVNVQWFLRESIDIISNGKSVKLNSTGNPGMTVGGTGGRISWHYWRFDGSRP